jgi:signal transduction histidine kinase
LESRGASQGGLDAEQIKQVLQNLLRNAIEATGEGGRVHIEARPVAKAGAVQQVQIEVSDSGAGIPEEHLEKIFTPFFTTKDSGTGLGLAVAHRIIEDHGGTMEVTSQVGRGTTFVITLPIDPRI